MNYAIRLRPRRGRYLPADLLQRIAAGDAKLEGLRPEDYSLVGKKVNEATSQAWTELSHVWEDFRPSLEKPAAPTDDAVTMKKGRRPSGRCWATVSWRRRSRSRSTARSTRSPTSATTCRSTSSASARILTNEWRRERRSVPSPHGMMQEFLNRSDAHLWGFVSNGLKLRVLRDNVRLTRQAFVEFDLQAIFDGKAYADFTLLWRLCHESRVNAERPEQCWLETWSKAADELGRRALDHLRAGVEKAIEALGRGFLHPRNAELIRWLRNRARTLEEYYTRCSASFTACCSCSSPRIAACCSTRRLRTRAAKATASSTRWPGCDGSPSRPAARPTPTCTIPWNWCCVRWGRDGVFELGLSELGGLFDPAGTPNLNGCVLGNGDLLEAVRALSVISEGPSQRAVDYRNLGSEELGSVYESLLSAGAVHPGAALVCAEVGSRERAEAGRCLLHADEPYHLPARFGPRSGAERGGGEAGRRGGPSEPEGMRSGRRLGPLPDRRGPSDRPQARRRPHAGGGAGLRRGEAGVAGRDRQVCLRRGREPDGGGVVPGRFVDGGEGAGQAAVISEAPHPVRQQPARHDTGPAGEGRSRRGVRGDRRR